MKRLVSIPPNSVDRLKRDQETGLGYQAVSVRLKDGRYFDQAIASEVCIIAVRGYEDVPFAPDEVASVTVTISVGISGNLRMCGVVYRRASLRERNSELGQI